MRIYSDDEMNDEVEHVVDSGGEVDELHDESDGVNEDKSRSEGDSRFNEVSSAQIQIQIADSWFNELAMEDRKLLCEENFPIHPSTQLNRIWLTISWTALQNYTDPESALPETAVVKAFELLQIDKVLDTIIENEPFGTTNDSIKARAKRILTDSVSLVLKRIAGDNWLELADLALSSKWKSLSDFFSRTLDFSLDLIIDFITHLNEGEKGINWEKIRKIQRNIRGLNESGILNKINQALTRICSVRGPNSLSNLVYKTLKNKFEAIANAHSYALTSKSGRAIWSSIGGVENIFSLFGCKDGDIPWIGDDEGKYLLIEKREKSYKPRKNSRHLKRSLVNWVELAKNNGDVNEVSDELVCILSYLALLKVGMHRYRTLTRTNARISIEDVLSIVAPNWRKGGLSFVYFVLGDLMKRAYSLKETGKPFGWSQEMSKRGSTDDDDLATENPGFNKDKLYLRIRVWSEHYQKKNGGKQWKSLLKKKIAFIPLPERESPERTQKSSKKRKTGSDSIIPEELNNVLLRFFESSG